MKIGALLLLLLGWAGPGRALASQEAAAVRRIPVRIVADRLVVFCDVSSPFRRLPVNLFVEFESPCGLQLHNRAAFALRAETEDGQPVPLKLHFPDFELDVARREHGDEEAFEEFTKYHSAELGENAVVGVLGAEIFQPFDVVLDLRAGYLELSAPAPDGSERPEVPEGTRAVQTSEHLGMVWLPVLYEDGHPAVMALGTRRYDTLLDALVCEELGHPAGDLESLRLADLDLVEWVALRPEEVILAHPDGVAGVFGLNLLRHLRVEVDRTHRVARITPTARPDFPKEDLAFFRAMVEEEADPVEEFLEEHPDVRLSHEAAELLLELRLDEDAGSEAVGRAIGFIHGTTLEDLRTTRMLDLMQELYEAGYPEYVIPAGERGIESGRGDRYPDAVHNVHSRMGAVLLESGEGRRAWRHLLSAAFGLPEDGMVNLNLGRFYEQEERYERAFSRFVQACIKPESGPEAIAGLQRVQDLLENRESFSVDLVERMVGGKVKSFGTATRYDPEEEGFGGRVALVEFFTNANLGNGDRGAIGGALGNQGLLAHFGPEHAVFLSYHLPTPTPDAMVNAVSMRTAEKLGVDAPVVHVINGRQRAPGAARWRQAEAVYQRCRGVVATELKRETEYRIELAGRIEGDVVSAEVAASGPLRTGLRLHVVLAERGVLFPGKSEVVIHRRVARAAMTDPPEGVVLPPEGLKTTLHLSLAEVRAANEAFLDELEQSGGGSTVRMSMAIDPAQVRLVAFLREPGGEVLQAVEVDPQEVAAGEGTR